MTYVRGHLRRNGWFRRKTYVRPHYRRSAGGRNEIALLAALVVGVAILWIILAH